MILRPLPAPHCYCRERPPLILLPPVGYVPSGMSPEEYKKLKAKEQKASKGKNLGAFGPQTFKSRSMQAFQKDLEAGKATHLLPVFNAKEKIKRGELREEDIPYMQRGGSWDNSDVKGAKKKMSWNMFDQNYDANADQRGVDWSGRNPRSGPQQRKPVAAEPAKKKGPFGLW